MHLSAEKHIEDPCPMYYMYFSNGLTWHIYISGVLVLDEASIKLLVECQQRFMPSGLCPFVVFGKLS